MSWIAGDTFGIVGAAPDLSMAVPPDVVQGITPQAAKTAWITFGSLILSLGAALIGAMAGRRRKPLS